MHFEHGRRDTAAAQLIGGGQAGGTAADNGDLLADQLGAGFELVAFLEGCVTDVLLHRIDADEVFHVVTVAAVLAGSRAHAAHHGRERVGVGRAAEGVFLHADALGRGLDATHDIQPAADVFTGWTAALTGWGTVNVGRALVGMITLENLV